MLIPLIVGGWPELSSILQVSISRTNRFLPSSYRPWVPYVKADHGGRDVQLPNSSCVVTITCINTLSTSLHYPSRHRLVTQFYISVMLSVLSSSKSRTLLNSYCGETIFSTCFRAIFTILGILPFTARSLSLLPCDKLILCLRPTAQLNTIK
jgi:hypothetical protein